VHEQVDEKCLRNPNILNYISSFDASNIFVVRLPIIYEIFDQITCLKIKINLVRR